MYDRVKTMLTQYVIYSLHKEEKIVMHSKDQSKFYK